MYCGSCGNAVKAEAKFCESCGSAIVRREVSTARPVPPAHNPSSSGPARTTVVPPPASDGDAVGALPAIDWMGILRGNWLGALLVALTTAASSGLMGMALALLAKPEDFGLGNTLTLATILATGAFGADVTAEIEMSGLIDLSGDASIAVYPFTITLVALVVAVLLFRWLTRTYTSGVDALTDALRASVIFGFCLLIPALIFTSDNDELGRGWGRELSDEALGMDAQVGADPAGAFFLGSLILAVVLGASALMRSQWWAADQAGRWWARAHSWARAPLAGAAATLLLLPLAGLVGLLSIALFGEDTDVDISGDETRLIVATSIGLLANGGVWLISLGTGSRMGYDGRADGEGREQDWERLWGEITNDEPGLWVAPAVALLVIGVSALIVLRRSERATALRSLGLWLASLVVVVPLLSRVTSFHVEVQAQEGRRDFDAEMYAGPDGFQTTVLVLLVALLVSCAVGLASGVANATTMRAQLQRMGRALQRPPSQPPAGAPKTHASSSGDNSAT